MGFTAAELFRDFEGSPATVSRSLRQLFETDRVGFIDQCTEVLKQGTRTPLAVFLLRVIGGDPHALERFTDPAHFTFEQSLELIRALMGTHETIPPRLLALLISEHHAVRDAWHDMRILEVATKCCDFRALLPSLTSLTRHQDTRIRSKAALLFARVTDNVCLVEERLRDPDERVRAAVVEGLWGKKSPSARLVLLRALRDTEHRVAANAAVGLYRAGDLASIPALRAMVERAEAPFQAAALWAMGETGDPRFIRDASAAMRISTQSVRGNAVRSLVRLRNVDAQRSVLPPLQVEARLVNNSLRVEVRTADRSPVTDIPDTAFIVEGQGGAAELSVDSVTCRVPTEPSDANDCDPVPWYEIAFGGPAASPLVVTVNLDAGKGQRRLCG